MYPLRRKKKMLVIVTLILTAIVTLRKLPGFFRREEQAVAGGEDQFLHRIDHRNKFHEAIESLEGTEEKEDRMMKKDEGGDSKKSFPSPFTEKCSVVHIVDHNNATVQVTDLVEKLDFKVGKNIAKEIYSGLKPLPQSEPLQVLLVPHSHCDPGWGLTYMTYYMQRVRYLLTNLYNFAMAHPDFKYIYAEVSFFKLWWTDQVDAVRANMRTLAREGRFEFVQGGWVQADEANTHYFALFNDMLDGHDWLRENFPEAVPKSGWAIDPFGLSPMKAHINKLFGLKGMHIERVHYRVKTHLAADRKIEFKWRQSWDSTGETDILTNVGQFFGYETDNTCGPDKDVCTKFTFNRRTGLEAKVTQSNVQELSELILDQWRKKAALHQTNTIFVEIGEDFAYVKPEAISDIYNNYTPLIDYINKTPSLNTQVNWGVLSEYFERVLNSEGAGKLPTLSGDFFTYADREADYWSGYYTSRPFYKNMDRVLESALRRTEILYSFTRGISDEEDLLAARHALSLFQHHDGITGTSVRMVMNDYGAILYDAYRTCHQLTMTAVKQLIGDRSVTPYQPVVNRKSFNSYDQYQVLDGYRELVLVNTVPRDIETVQMIAIPAELNVGVQLGGGGVRVFQQTEPHIEYGVVNPASHYVVFQAFSRSVSMEKYFVQAAATQPQKTTVELYNASPGDSESFSENFDTISHHEESCSPITLGSEDSVIITIDCKSGRLTSMKRAADRGLAMDVDQELLLYRGHGGAYLFRPNSAPEVYLNPSSRPKVVVTKGPLRHRAVVTLSDLVVFSYTVNLVADTEHAELEILTNLQENGDLVLRFKTDIGNQDTLFTDNNGHTIQQHRYKDKLHIQGNFFPMPSLAFIQDRSRRFSLLSSEPHGVASLSNGYLEVVLDRRFSNSNDNRGLPEGIRDNLPTPARFRLLLESRVEPDEQQQHQQDYKVEYPSLLSHRVLETLLHPVFLAHRQNTDHGDTTTGLQFRQLIREFPCDEELVNLRHVEDATSLLIRRKLGFSCNIDNSGLCQATRYPDLRDVFVDNDVTTKPHPFSPFHEMTETDKRLRAVESRAMQFTSDYVNFR